MSLRSLISDNGRIIVPFHLASTNGAVQLPYGPKYKKTTVRIFARMPDLDEAMNLPVPLGYDRSAARFRLDGLVSASSLMPNIRCRIFRVDTTRGPGQHKVNVLTKDWEISNKSRIYPILEVRSPQLQPDDIIEAWIETKFYRPQAFSKAIPLPMSTLYAPWIVYAMAQATWLPARMPASRPLLVNGDPLDHVSYQSPMATQPDLDPLSVEAKVPDGRTAPEIERDRFTDLAPGDLPPLPEPEKPSSPLLANLDAFS